MTATPGQQLLDKITNVMAIVEQMRSNPKKTAGERRDLNLTIRYLDGMIDAAAITLVGGDRLTLVALMRGGVAELVGDVVV